MAKIGVLYDKEIKERVFVVYKTNEREVESEAEMLIQDMVWDKE